jgi:hypothetical protein
MKFKYYKVNGGKLADKMKELRDAKDTFTNHMNEIVKSVGGINWEQFTTGSVAGINFTERPDKKVWKTASRGFLPKVSTKEGKKIHALITKLKAPKAYSTALSLFSLDGRMIFGEGTINGVPMHRPQIVGKFEPCIFFIKVPVSDDENYTPTDDDMVECKEWEMMKFMEE